MQRMAGGCSDNPLPSACSEVSLTDVEPMDRCEGDEMDGSVSRKTSVIWRSQLSSGLPDNPGEIES